MNELDIKEIKRAELFKLLKAKTVICTRVRNLLKSIEIEVNVIREEFDALDYELAMKTRTIIPSQKAIVKKNVKSFTLDEIKSIAIKLGVEITIKEEDEK